MRHILTIFLLLAIAACTTAPDPDKDEHYREWQEPSGWHPDYHDK